MAAATVVARIDDQSIARAGRPQQTADGLDAHERAIRRQDEEAPHAIRQVAHPPSQRRVHAERVLRVEDMPEALRVEDRSHTLRLVAEHDDGLDPHVAEALRGA